MFAFDITTIVITDTKLFNRTGQVGLWAARVEAKFTANAKTEAPHGGEKGRWNKSNWSKANLGVGPAGSLRRSISGEVVRIGPRHLQTTVSVDVPYALAVIRGTGTIFSKGARVPRGEEGAGQFREIGFGRGMYLPANPGWGKARFRQRVRGQSANNFLGRAFDRTAITHPSLRGYQMVG